MGQISYNYSAEAFTSSKRNANVLERLQSVEGQRELLEQQLFENMIEDGGQYCLINNFNTIDENGYYMDLSADFIIYTEETNIADALEQLSSEQMTIINEIYPYTYEGFDEGNTQITIFANGTNGLTQPVIDINLETFFDLFQFYEYSINMDTNEINGLNSKFGFPSGSSASQQINASISTIASEVVNSYQSERMILKRTSRTKVQPTQFINIDTNTTLEEQDSFQENSGDTTTPAITPGAVTTSTSRSY